MHTPPTESLSAALASLVLAVVPVLVLMAHVARQLLLEELKKRRKRRAAIRRSLQQAAGDSPAEPPTQR